MVDRAARRRLAEGLRRLGWGRITNDEFVDSCIPLHQSSDSAVLELMSTADSFYGDLKAYKLRGKHALSKRQKKFIARMIIFLHTEHEYSGPQMGPSGGWTLFVLSGMLLGGILSFFSTLAAVIFLSVAIFYLMYVAAVMLGEGVVELVQRPRQRHDWRGLRRSFFLQHPSWPFGSLIDYRAALRTPPYFAGRK